MEIGAVVSKAYTNAGTQADRSQQAAQAQQAERREPRAEERREKKDEAPRPATNAQGQTTGAVINVTA